MAELLIYWQSVVHNRNYSLMSVQKFVAAFKKKSIICEC